MIYVSSKQGEIGRGALTLVMQQEFTGHVSHDNQTAVA